MNKKGCRTSALSAAIVSTLAMAAVSLPSNAAFAKSTTATQPAKRNAIIGTGADAIIGTGADAIIGTGADAIIGTGHAKSAKRNAIIGTGADAIIGTGADAIIGTGADRYVTVMGPVEKLDRRAGTLTIYGQQLRVPESSSFMHYVDQAMASGNTVEVAVLGRVDATGKLNGAVARVVPGQYVPGLSKVVLTNRVTAVDKSTGRVVVGAYAVDYSSLLATKQIALAIGDIVTVTGTQPQANQAVVATGLIVRGR
jgi:hypothetical protein